MRERENLIKADLHVHTRFDLEQKLDNLVLERTNRGNLILTAKNILVRSGRNGVTIVGLVGHGHAQHWEEALNAQEEYQPNSELKPFFLLGVEFPTRRKKVDWKSRFTGPHLLGYFPYPNEVDLKILPKHLSPEETIHYIHENKGVAVLPHLITDLKPQLGQLFSAFTLKEAEALALLIDGVEKNCSPAANQLLDDLVLKINQERQERRLRPIFSVISTDSHGLATVGEKGILVSGEIKSPPALVEYLLDPEAVIEFYENPRISNQKPKYTSVIDFFRSGFARR